MKIQRLHVRGFRGLDDVTIEFPEPTLAYGSIDLRFFAGRNGSGKSSALEALGLIFSHLAVGAHPGFDYEVDYAVRDTQVRLKTQSSSTVVALVKGPDDADFSPFPIGTTNTALMPDRIIGYSTGPTSGMELALFDAAQSHAVEIGIDEEDDDLLEP